MKAKAPGKLILSGEHSVVYGAPAIAFAVDNFVTATFSPDHSGQISIETDRVGRFHASLNEIDQLSLKLDERYERFIEEEIAVTDLLASPGELIFYSLSKFPSIQGGRISITSTIPVGSGMGSSAAVIAATLKLAESISEVTLPSLYAFAEQVRYCERLQHGRGSMIDAAATTFGGAVRVQGEVVEPLQLSLGSGWYRCHTGEPDGSTGEVVAEVRRRHQKSDIWSEFSDIAARWTQGLSHSEIVELVRQNHRLLNCIGVVPEKVRVLISEVERMGGAAKICGAGAVKGEKAGTVLVYLPELFSSQAVQALGIELIPLQQVNQGAHLAKD
ncbi:mevalonate kinase [uncultured Neptuniibacter sp.]|uniref:mevalonate kinase family protein n=1 Tax=uncultured Neptuniibacter sp. TaxID=502143 RepID=UPI002616040F|nr:mevalonate kinase [uncultured Neptuniibacter sp.]